MATKEGKVPGFKSEWRPEGNPPVHEFGKEPKREVARPPAREKSERSTKGTHSKRLGEEGGRRRRRGGKTRKHKRTRRH